MPILIAKLTFVIARLTESAEAILIRFFAPLAILTFIMGIFVNVETLYGNENPYQNMSFIHEGEFIMGSGPETGRQGYDYGVDEEPRHRVYLKAFYIDRYEVTIGEYKEYLSATGGEWPGDQNFPGEFPPEDYFNPPERDKYPVNYIGWVEADAYCRWRGKRLPTETEWEKAARGVDGRIWPSGGRFDPMDANVRETGNPWPTPVGSYPKDKSPFGLYDVVGNLSEWTSSHYLPYPGNKYDDGRYSTKTYVLKGGAFLLAAKHGRPASRSLAYPTYAHRMYGIRCAKDAP